MKKLKALFSAERAPRLLAAALGLFVFVGVAYAVGYTTYTNLRVTNLTNLVGAVTMDGTLAVTGASTLGTVTASTATFRIRQSTAPSSANTAVQIVPIGIGDLVINWTDKEVCVATGTSRLQWVKIATPTVACGH